MRSDPALARDDPSAGRPQPDEAIGAAGCLPITPKAISSLISSLCRIQRYPPGQLTRTDANELRESLATIRGASQLPSTMRLPEAAWQVLDTAGHDAGLQLLFARRLVSQWREAEKRERFLHSNLVEPACSSVKLLKTNLGLRLLRSRYHSWYLRLMQRLPNQLDSGVQEYERWQKRQREVSESLPALRQVSSAWPYRPRISVLMAVRNARVEWLEDAIQSIQDQSYDNWELCVCDDNSEDPRIHKLLKSMPESDGRFLTTLSDARLGESGAFNRAAALASGDYVACLDHDDMLAPEALYRVVEALQTADAEVVYTDEDFMNEQGMRIRPHFKPDWSPRLLDSCMYLGHLVVVRRRLFEELGGFRGEFDGAQDFDFALRATEQAKTILHIPQIGYHWRMHPNSVAADASKKPRTHVVGQRALEDAIIRRSLTGASAGSSGIPNLFFLERRLFSPPSVDIVFVSRDQHTASPVDLLRNTSYSPLTAVMVGYREATTARMQRAVPEIRVVPVDSGGRRDLGHLANLGAKWGESEILVFLDDSLSIVTTGWLDLLVKRVSGDGAAIAGAKIVDSSGRIDHAGIVIGLGDGAGRLGRGIVASANWLWLDVAREVSAVGFDCLAIRREVFEGLNGFDGQMGEDYQAIDLCLRAAQAGQSVMIEARSVLRRVRLPSKTVAPAVDWANFVERWHSRLSKPDPFYSPNLRLDQDDIQLF